MRKITLLDGATGTSLWAKSDDRNPVWTYNITRPDIVRRLQEEFIETGAKIICSNSFGANRPAVEASSRMDVLDIVAKSVRLSHEALDNMKSKAPDGRYDDVKIALDFGPLSSMLEPWGDLSRESCRAIYAEVFKAGMEEGADMIFLMTFMDLDMLVIAAEEAVKYGVPVFATMSFTEFGKTIMGNSPSDMVAALEPLGAAAVGVNCSLGPDKALPILKEFAGATSLPLIFKPNAGIPIMSSDGQTANPCTPESFAEAFIPALEYATYVGGCCGTSPEYLAAIKKVIDNNI